MNNETFYSTAATVVPILLFAMMAARNLAPGQFNSQKVLTLFLFGLPALGAVGAFAYLFFKPQPRWAAGLLAGVTWAGLASQFAFAGWWISELISPPAVGGGGAAGHAENNGAPPPKKKVTCPACQAEVDAGTICTGCGQMAPAD